MGTVQLQRILDDIAQTLKYVDTVERPHYSKWPAGIGAFPETKIVMKVWEHLKNEHPDYKESQLEKHYPVKDTKEARCDFYIPGAWAIEFKVSQVFMSKDMEDENWSRRILHPFLDVKNKQSVSLIGDCIKLSKSNFSERKAVVLIHFEHQPEDIDVGIAIKAFEYIVQELLKIELAERCSSAQKGLIHPHHQQVKLFGWEVKK